MEEQTCVEMKPPAGTSVFSHCLFLTSLFGPGHDVFAPISIFTSRFRLIAFISSLTMWSERWTNKICKLAICKLDTICIIHCMFMRRRERWGLEGFFWIALPYLLISCASVAQCGTSSSRCLLFPPPSRKITVGNLFGTQTSHRGERGGEITTGSRFEEK